MVYDPIGEDIGIAHLIARDERVRRFLNGEDRYIKIGDKALRRFLSTGKTRSDGTRGAEIRNFNGGRLKRLPLRSYAKLPVCFTDPMGVFIVGENSRRQIYCAEFSQLKRCGWAAE